MLTRKEVHGAIHTFSLSNVKNVRMHRHVTLSHGLQKEQKEPIGKQTFPHVISRQNKQVLSDEILHLLDKSVVQHFDWAA